MREIRPKVLGTKPCCWHWSSETRRQRCWSAISLAQHCHDSGNQDQDAYKELGAGNDATISKFRRTFLPPSVLKNLSENKGMSRARSRRLRSEMEKDKFKGLRHEVAC